MKRFVAIWFPRLETDWFTIRNPELKNVPFILARLDHGRLVVHAANSIANSQGIDSGMNVADARALIPSLRVIDSIPGLPGKILERMAEWCIRYTPAVAIDHDDGIIFDATGCAHLWGGELEYITEILNRFGLFNYKASAAIADTIGTAWAIARFGGNTSVIKKGESLNALLDLPPAALRLELEVTELLQKLGLHCIRDFIGIPRAVLRRRFGELILLRLDQALGKTEEIVQSIIPVIPFVERLPCLEPIVTRTGIEIALKQLLEELCDKLRKEDLGIRSLVFTCFRIDGKPERIEIGTNRSSHNNEHLFHLFEYKLDSIEPGLGIEVFLLEAQKVEPIKIISGSLWKDNGGLEDPRLSELVDRLEMKIGKGFIKRYLTDEHHWPERSIKLASSLDESSFVPWITGRPRPIVLFNTPRMIEVTAPVPDYPPMLFRYEGKVHKVKRADGPERIEPEWWLEQPQHRDYYCVEDEEGDRYWLYRAGHYSSEKKYQWYIHGIFA